MKKKITLFSIFFLIFLQSVWSQQNEHNYIQKLESLSSNDRIIYLHYILGNENYLIDNPEILKSFIEKLQTTNWKDKEFENHVQFFSETYPAIIIKKVPKRIILLETYLNKYSPNSVFYGNLMHQLGINSFVNKEYANAFLFLIPAQNLFEKIGWKKIPEAGMYLHDMALVFYTFKDYDNAIKCMNTSLQLKPFSQNLDIQRYNTLAVAYEKTNKIDSALKYYRNVLEVSGKYNDTFWMAQSILNINSLDTIAPLEIQYNLIKSAFKYIEKNQNSTVDITDEYDYLFWYLKLAELKIYLRSPKYSEAATQIANEILNMPSLNESDLFRWNQRNEQFNVEKFETLKNYFTSINNFKNALNYTDSFYTAKSKNELYESSNTLALSIDKLKLAENTLSLEKYKLNKKVNYSVIALLILCLLLILFFYLFMRNKKEKENILIINKNKDLNHKLAINNQELENYVQNIITKNEMIEKITLELESIQHQNILAVSESEIENTINSLKNFKILTYEDWKSFQQIFASVNKNLNKKLSTIEPKLTEGEQRFLMLSSLNMNNKDMAASLGVSPDSLRVTWSRLKKKFPEINPDTPLHFIQYIEELETI